jgi:hypothetical protein
MKPLITKRNSIFFVLNKSNHVYLTMATLTFMNLKMVFIIKKILSSLKLYIPFLLTATRCNKVDYWFEKPRMKGPNFCLVYKHNF